MLDVNEKLEIKQSTSSCELVCGTFDDARFDKRGDWYGVEEILRKNTGCNCRSGLFFADAQKHVKFSVAS